MITLADVEAVWPLVQDRLASNELAEASSSDDVSPSSLNFDLAMSKKNDLRNC